MDQLGQKGETLWQSRKGKGKGRSESWRRRSWGYRTWWIIEEDILETPPQSCSFPLVSIRASTCP
jgi:hypothetical protein